MKIRGHSNVVALALGGLAVVLATTGTAYAVTASTVTIVDPTSPSRAARVDASGRLATTAQSASVVVTTQFGFDTTSPVTSPTKASLAISSVAFANPALNSQFAGSTFTVGLVEISAGSDGLCNAGTNGSTVVRTLMQTVLEPGDSQQMTYPAPLLVTPPDTSKYCVGLSVGHFGSGQTSLYLAPMTLTAYVQSGTYTGVGTGATPAAPPATSNRPVSR